MSVENNECTEPLNKHHSDGYPFHEVIHVRSSSSREQSRNACLPLIKTIILYLFNYNIIILILGLCVLGVGIWLHRADSSTQLMYVIDDTNLYQAVISLIISAGGIIVLLVLCVCLGAIRRDRCVFIFFLVLLELCCAGSLVFKYRGELSNVLEHSLNDLVVKKYGVDIRTNIHNRMFTNAWDSVQENLQCCGVTGGVNSTLSWSIYKLKSTWYLLSNSRVPYVPDSCCSGNTPVCTGTERVRGPPNYGPPVSPNYVKNDYMYTEGCYDKLLTVLERNSLILGLVALSIPVIMVIVVVVGCIIQTFLRRHNNAMLQSCDQ